MTKIPPKPRDETPASFADLKPPGYWCDGHFVPVRVVPESEFDRETGRHIGPRLP